MRHGRAFPEIWDLVRHPHPWTCGPPGLCEAQFGTTPPTTSIEFRPPRQQHLLCSSFQSQKLAFSLVFFSGGAGGGGLIRDHRRPCGAKLADGMELRLVSGTLGEGHRRTTRCNMISKRPGARCQIVRRRRPTERTASGTLGEVDAPSRSSNLDMRNCDSRDGVHCPGWMQRGVFTEMKPLTDGRPFSTTGAQLAGITRPLLLPGVRSDRGKQ